MRVLANVWHKFVLINFVLIGDRDAAKSKTDYFYWENILNNSWILK